MAMKNFILFTIIASIFFWSCEKQVRVDIPQKTPKLVVNAWLNQDQDVTVKVGKSRHVLDPVNMQSSNREIYTVKNAVPVLYENNVAFDTLVFNSTDYLYKSRYNKKIRPGYTYTIRVNASGFTEAEAVTLVPSSSEIAEVKWVQHVRTNSDGFSMDDVTIKLNDPAEPNVYLIQFFSSYVYTTGDANPIYCVSTNDKDIELLGNETDPLNPDNCFDGGKLLMKDTHFNGTQKQVKFSIESDVLKTYSDPNTNRIRRPYIKVYRITEDYFKFLKSYSIYNSSDENPFAEPVNVFSNVKNGYGIFSAYTVAVDSLR